MKTVLLAILGSLALTACASTAKYSNGDSTSQGVKVALGSADGIKAGDKIKALEKDCAFDGRSKGCHYTTVGYLTVDKVEGEKSLVAKPDSDLKLNESIYFEKFSSCPEKRTKSDKGC